MCVLREAQDFCLIFDPVDSGLWTGKDVKKKKKGWKKKMKVRK